MSILRPLLRRVSFLWLSPDCFPAGTMVLTREGYRPIEQIEVGDEVLTHAQRWRRVTEVSSAVRPLLRLRGHGHPGLLVSPEHPFYARPRLDTWGKRALGAAQWTSASAIGPDWYWATPTAFPVDAPPAVPVYKDRETTISEELMWVVGRYVADGWTRLTDTRAELVITCGRHEVDGLRSRLSLWPRAGARSGSNEMAWHERETGTAYQFTVNHRGLVEWLREHFGHGAAEKRIPGWALGMDAALRAALLAGYVSGDGWSGWHKGVITEVGTVSKALAFGVKALASSLGKTVAVYVAANTNVIEGRKVNALPSWRLRWREDPSPAHHQTERDERGLEWAPIRGREDAADAAEVFNIGVEEDESYVVDGIVVHNCKHHSKAKGGKPVDRRIRGLAWEAVRWAAQARPDVICLENVQEFADWCRVGKDGRPVKGERGRTFRKFVRRLEALGYVVETRLLRACDYGAPTTRERLFLVARCDGKSIVWPAPTHSKDGRGGILPWRTAAECIDFSIPCPSIFLTPDEAKALGVRRPLAEKTERRIARGIDRFVIRNPRPFIVPVNHAGDLRVHSIDEPIRTITGAHRGEHALVSAALATIDQQGSGGSATSSVESPLPTTVAKNRHALIAPLLVPRYGEREGQDPRARAVDRPAPVIVPTQNGGSLVSAFLAKHFGGNETPGSQLGLPIDTITARDHNALVTAEVQPAPATRADAVRAFLIKYHRDGGQLANLFDPAPTVVTKDSIGLVMVDGEPHVIADIGMRMLRARELFRCQGFPDTYQIDIVCERRVNGKLKRGPLPAEAQVRMVGNSVCPQLSKALALANRPDSDGLIVDLFAGGGGTSLGLEWAFGRSPHIAINHDREAVAMHMVNHPETLHYTEDVRKVDIRAVVADERLVAA